MEIELKVERLYTDVDQGPDTQHYHISKAKLCNIVTLAVDSYVGEYSVYSKVCSFTLGHHIYYLSHRM